MSSEARPHSSSVDTADLETKNKRNSYNPLAVSDIRREDILRHVFGDVGTLIDDFSCAVESKVLLHGRMYVTTRFLCFYSNLFGLEKKIRIPYTHITAVAKENTALVIPNAIAISTIRKEYIFRSFWDREECFRMLKEHIKGMHVSQGRGAALTSGTIGGSGRHGHTLKKGERPLRSPSRDQDTQVAMMLSDKDRPRADKAKEREEKRPGSVSSAPTEDEASTFTPSLSSLPLRVRGKDSMVQLNNDDSSDEENEEEKGEEGDTAVTEEEQGDDELGDIVEHTEWQEGQDPSAHKTVSSDEAGAGNFSPAQVKEAISHATLKIVVDKKILPITVTDFAKMFVEDSAPYSWSKYHELVGDSQLNVSAWSNMSAADLGHLGSGREIRFFKPVNLPGLKDTRGVKLQKYQRFGGQGLIVHSSTRLEDVPAADTFTVEDVVTVRRPDAHEILRGEGEGEGEGDGEGGAHSDRCIVVEISFEVRFIKSTFLKYMIETNTISEMTKWLQAWVAHIYEKVVDRGKQTERKLASIKKILDVHADDDDGEEEEEEDDANDVSGSRKALKSTAKRIRRLSTSIKDMHTCAKIQVSEAFSSWQRVEGRRFFVLCFALLLILSSMMYWQMKHMQVSMHHMHTRMTLLTDEVVAIRELLDSRRT